MTERIEVSAETTRLLAKLAGLPLAEGREALLAPQLGEWLMAANELNRKMSEPEYSLVTPVTVFVHQVAKEKTNDY